MSHSLQGDFKRVARYLLTAPRLFKPGPYMLPLKKGTNPSQSIASGPEPPTQTGVQGGSSSRDEGCPWVCTEGRGTPTARRPTTHLALTHTRLFLIQVSYT